MYAGASRGCPERDRVTAPIHEREARPQAASWGYDRCEMNIVETSETSSMYMHLSRPRPPKSGLADQLG